MHFKVKLKGEIMSVGFRKFSFALYTDKYLNVKVVNCGENRVCVGGKCVHASVLITAPILNRFSSFLYTYRSICPLPSVKKSDQYLK